MRPSLVLLLLPLAACDTVFGLDKVTHDASIDAPPDVAIDAPACENSTPFGTTCRTITLPLTGDSYLTSTAPDTVEGQRDGLKMSPNEPGLFKFYTGPIAAGERIAEMKLELDPYFGMNAKVCNDTDPNLCMACPTADIGLWHIGYVRADWLQSEATWNQAGPGRPWTQPGASAVPQDRSDVLMTDVGPASGLLDMTIPSAVLLAHSPDCYRAADAIALRVTIDGLAYFEAQEANLCSNDTVTPNLTVTLCK